MSKWQCVQSNGAWVAFFFTFFGDFFFFAKFRPESHEQETKPGVDRKGMGNLLKGLYYFSSGSMNRTCDPGRGELGNEAAPVLWVKPGIGWNINAPCVYLSLS